MKIFLCLFNTKVVNESTVWNGERLTCKILTKLSRIFKENTSNFGVTATSIWFVE